MRDFTKKQLMYMSFITSQLYLGVLCFVRSSFRLYYRIYFGYKLLFYMILGLGRFYDLWRIAMITNPKIEVGDVGYSKLSQVLRFTIAVDEKAIQMVEDICGAKDMSADQISLQMAKLLESAIHMHYHRGGHRIKYD